MGETENRSIGDKSSGLTYTQIKAKRQRYMRKVATSKDKGIKSRQRGVLVTCGTRQESQCIKESLLLLSEFAEKLIPGLFDDGSKDDEGSTADKTKNLEDELGKLRDQGKGQGGAVFSRSDVGVHGTIFIKFERDDLDPAKVVTELLDDVRETGLSRSRYAVRFIPVHDSCYAKPAEAAAMCEKLAKEKLPPAKEDAEDSEKPTFAIVFRKSNSSMAHREDYIKQVADVMPKGYKVNLKNPDWVLVLEVMKATCCAALLKRYYELGKFNIQTVCERSPKAAKAAEVDKQPQAQPPQSTTDVEKTQVGAAQSTEASEKVENDEDKPEVDNSEKVGEKQENAAEE
ncbi:hypothetical protein NDN08_008161 [Rhodosorus marinus]|uniref:THUMP domain-containing protein n=1 Tax=Rhodosorus marinus TaxID=101924 RepID=A0AAV8V198_9RHOD|nr:hypothetical protein NDN08_008161 [Rhodosorus marinus]